MYSEYADSRQEKVTLEACEPHDSYYAGTWQTYLWITMECGGSSVTCGRGLSYDHAPLLPS